MFRKYAGDDIAANFKKLLAKKIEKKASMEMEAQSEDMADMAEDAGMSSCAEDCQCSKCGDGMMGMAKDIMTSQSDDSQDSFLSDELDMVEDHTKEARIMRGLGKIAASLRSKGEHFASDVVEATARSIQGDFVKEANQKKVVTTELQKMARNMRISGNRFGADLVEASIKKIKNS